MSCEKGTVTSIKQATKKFQVKPQDLYANLTLFSKLLQYNVGTDFKTLKDTYYLVIETFTKKTNFAFQQQQESLERLEDNLREEVRSHTHFLLECFSQEAYHRFLKDRSTADEQRKLKDIDEPTPEQFADYEMSSNQPEVISSLRVKSKRTNLYDLHGDHKQLDK